MKNPLRTYLMPSLSIFLILMKQAIEGLRTVRIKTDFRWLLDIHDGNNKMTPIYQINRDQNILREGSLLKLKRSPQNWNNKLSLSNLISQQFQFYAQVITVLFIENQINQIIQLSPSCSAMSLIHRRKSAIFNAPSSHPSTTSTYKMKVQSIIDNYKSKFSFNHSSIETEKKPIVEKLSLSQAKKLQKLHEQIINGPRVSSALTKTSNSNYATIVQPSEIRKKSLHFLLEGYQRNIPLEAEEKNTIDPERLELFRKGKFYRSNQRASGAGVCKVSKQSLAVYYKFNDNPEIELYQEPKLIEKSISRRPFSTLDSRSGRGKSTSAFSNSRVRQNQRSQRSHRNPMNQGNQFFSTLPLRSTFRKNS